MTDYKLPQDPQLAVRHVMKIVERLTQIMEDEGKALAVGDSMAFAAVQAEKDQKSKEYQQASAAFKVRAQDFLDVDRPTLDRLDASQRALAAKAEENGRVIKTLRERLGDKIQVDESQT